MNMEAMLRRGLVILTTYPPAYNAPIVPGGAMAVFGRYSADLAVMVGEICNQARPKHLVVSGHKGKDSGLLATWGVPEAHYIVSVAAQRNRYAMSQVELAIDLQAINGLENARNMTRLLGDFGYTQVVDAQLLVVAHSTQMVRLGATLNGVLSDAGIAFTSVRWVPSSYRPSLARLQDQREICFELLKLAEMEKAGWNDVPPIEAELLEWAAQYIEVVEADLANLDLTFSTAGLSSF